MISEVLLLVKQVRPRRAEVDNLRTSVTILFQPRTLKAVECVADAFAATDNALVLVVSEGALVTDAGESGGSHVGVADRTFTVAFVAQSSERNAGLLAAHDEIGVMAGHVCSRMRGGVCLEMYWR